MARSRIRKRGDARVEQKPKATWPSDVVVKLLAWIDFTAEKDGTGKLFNDTIVHHLRTACDIEYQESQVDRKVRSMLNSGGRTGRAKALTDLYKNGTETLEWLDDNLRDECIARSKELKSWELLQNLSPRRELRSDSRTPDSILLRRISNRLRNTQSPSPCPPRHRASLAEDCPSFEDYSNGEYFSNVPSISEHLQVPKSESFAAPCHAIRRWAVASISEDGPTTQYSRPTSEFSRQLVDCRSPTVSDLGTGRDSSTMELTESQRSTEPLFGCRASVENIKHAAPEPSNTAISCNCAGIRRELCALQRDNIALESLRQSEAAEARKQHEALSRELTCLKSSYKQVSTADKQSTTHLLKLRQMEIKELKTSLDRKERYRDLFLLSTQDHVPLDRKQIRAEMIQIKGAIKELLGNRESSDVFQLPKTNLEEGLAKLLCRTFALDLTKPNALPDWQVSSCSFALQAVIRSLAAAAICEWVFEADLPTISYTANPLLEQYRLHLAIQDGVTALRNLDLGAHKSLFAEEIFQLEVIPRTATRLAERFAGLVAPFLSQSSDSELSAAVLEACLQELPTLIEIFRRALKVKMCSMISDKLFEAVMYTSGAPFQLSCMDPETLEGDQAQLRLYKDPVIKLCILPALVAYEGNRTLNGFQVEATRRL